MTNTVCRRPFMSSVKFHVFPMSSRIPVKTKSNARWTKKEVLSKVHRLFFNVRSPKWRKYVWWIYSKFISSMMDALDLAKKSFSNGGNGSSVTWMDRFLFVRVLNNVLITNSNSTLSYTQEESHVFFSQIILAIGRRSIPKIVPFPPLLLR